MRFSSNFLIKSKLDTFSKSLRVWIISFSLCFDPVLITSADPIKSTQDFFNERSKPTSQKHFNIFTINPNEMVKGKEFHGVSSHQIILIKDIHCQSEAQLLIAKAIQRVLKEMAYHKNVVSKEIFNKQKDPRINVLLEGASGRIQVELYRTFPNSIVKEKIAWRFLRRGYLTGAEYAAIHLDPNDNLVLFGIEEPKVYVENFFAFHKTKKFYDELNSKIKLIDQWVNMLKRLNYSARMKELDQIREAIEKGEQLDLEKIVIMLSKEMGKKSGRIKRLWKELLPLRKILGNRQKLDEKIVQKQLREIVIKMQKTLRQNQLKEMIKATLEFRLGKIEFLDYLNVIEKLYGRKNLKARYEMVLCWRDFLKNIQNLADQTQLEKLGVIVEVLMKEEAQKFNNISVLKMNNDWMKFKKLCELELRRSERIPAIMRFDFNSKAFFSFTMFDLLYSMASLFQSAESFYKLAFERDGIMTKKALRVINKKSKQSQGGSDSKISILITGGFHTDGIQKILEQKSISYVTWTPKIACGINKSIYENVMKEQLIKLEKLSYRSFMVPSSSPAIRNMLSPILMLERELHQELGEEAWSILSSYLTRLIQELMRSDKITVNGVVNRWFKNHRKVLKKISDQDFSVLLKVICKIEGVAVRFDQLPKNKWARKLALAVLKRSFGVGSGMLNLGVRWAERKNKKKIVQVNPSKPHFDRKWIIKEIVTVAAALAVFVWALGALTMIITIWVVVARFRPDSDHSPQSTHSNLFSPPRAAPSAIGDSSGENSVLAHSPQAAEQEAPQASVSWAEYLNRRYAPLNFDGMEEALRRCAAADGLTEQQIQDELTRINHMLELIYRRSPHFFGQFITRQNYLPGDVDRNLGSTVRPWWAVLGPHIVFEDGTRWMPPYRAGGIGEFLPQDLLYSQNGMDIYREYPYGWDRMEQDFLRFLRTDGVMPGPNEEERLRFMRTYIGRYLERIRPASPAPPPPRMPASDTNSFNPGDGDVTDAIRKTAISLAKMEQDNVGNVGGVLRLTFFEMVTGLAATVKRQELENRLSMWGEVGMGRTRGERWGGRIHQVVYKMNLRNDGISSRNVFDSAA